MLASGVDVVRVSRMLGHASPAITLNVYAHVIPAEHHDDADALLDLVRASASVTAIGRAVPKRSQEQDAPAEPVVTV